MTELNASLPDMTRLLVNRTNFRANKDIMMVTDISVDPQAYPGGLVSYANNVNQPDYFASCVKLIIADLINNELRFGDIKPDESLQIPSAIQGEGEHYNQTTVKEALRDMLHDSSNTAANAFIKRLGGEEEATRLAHVEGFANTTLRYLNLPSALRNTSGYHQPAQSTAMDMTLAMRKFVKAEQNEPNVAMPAVQKAAVKSLIATEKPALESPDVYNKLPYEGRQLQKIGYTSSTMADVGLVHGINGHDYVVVQRFQANGNSDAARQTLIGRNNLFYDEVLAKKPNDSSPTPIV